jgi:hypothetical protein
VEDVRPEQPPIARQFVGRVAAEIDVQVIRPASGGTP